MTDETHFFPVSRSVTGMSRVCGITRHLPVTSASRKGNGANYVANFYSIANPCAHRTRLITYSAYTPADLAEHGKHGPAFVNAVYTTTPFGLKHEPPPEPGRRTENSPLHRSSTSGIPYGQIHSVTKGRVERALGAPGRSPASLPTEHTKSTLANDHR